MKDSASQSVPLSPLKRALLALEDMESRLARAEHRLSEPIAIIGIGCRFPQASNPCAFWQLLRDGGDAVREVPASRWPIDQYFNKNPDAPGKMSTRWAALLESVDQFEPEFFGISAREATRLDPQQRLLLEVSWEALENAGQSPSTIASKQSGVFIGVTGDEYSHLFFRNGDPSLFNPYFASGIARSMAAGRISYTLGLQGPNLSVDTACSSSLVAVHIACMHLRTGECDTALAGGVNVVLSPEIAIAFSKAHMMAADGRCKPFDSRADGFVRGEGCGIVVLKRMSDALADGDNILACIRGSAVNQDGRSGGLTVPNGNAQQAVLRQAITNAGVKASEIDYIEAHGTGTALGDPIEAHALAAVLGPQRDKHIPLILGALKSNVGHLEAAAGIAGLIKVVLALQQEEIPRNLHFKQINPHIDWAGLPVDIPTQGRPWPRGRKRRLAGVSAFGFSGTNAHVIVEEAPDVARKVDTENILHVLTISARNDKALGEQITKYEENLRETREDIGDVCFTSGVGRAHWEQRIAIIGSDMKGLVADLQKRKVQPRDRPLPMKGMRAELRPVFFFSGEAEDCFERGRELYEVQPCFRANFAKCAELLKGEIDEPITNHIFGGSSEFLQQPIYREAGLFCIEYSLAEMWKSWGVQPAALFGCGTGEYVALCVAGQCGLADGLRLVAIRERFPKQERTRALADGAAKIAWLTPDVRVISTVTGTPVQDQMKANAYWHAGDPVRREEAFDFLKQTGHHTFLELGGNSHVEGALNLTAEDQWLHSFEGRRSGWEQTLENVAKLYEMGLDLDWHSFYAGTGRRRVPLPTYPFQRSRFWPDIPTPRVKLNRPIDIAEHPLLGTRLDLAGDLATTVWENQLTADTVPYPADLCESGARVFPLTGYVEMMTAAVRAADERSVELNVVHLHEPLRLDPNEPKTVQTIKRDHSIEVYSRERETWTLRATATIGIANGYQVVDSPFFELGWESISDLPSARNVNGEWLILADREGFAERLAELISASGGSCAVSRDISQIATLPIGHQRGIIHCLALDTISTEQLTAADLERFHRQSCETALNLVQRMSSRASSAAPRLWFITRGSQPVLDSSALSIGQAALWGFARTVAEEYPEYRCTSVDLDPEHSDDPQDALLRELGSSSSEQQVAYRNGRRYAPRLALRPPRSITISQKIGPSVPAHLRTDVQESATTANRNATSQKNCEAIVIRQSSSSIRLHSNDTYLIAGGFGGLGLRLGRWLVERGARNLVLLGRHGINPGGSTLMEWAQSQGARVISYSVNISSRAELANVFSDMAKRMPPLRGIIQAAGILDDGILANQNWARFENVFESKVQGSWNLHELTASVSLDFFILFSSIASITGSAGQANYAAANAFQDSLAHFRRQIGLPAISVNWGAWADGMSITGAAGNRHKEAGLMQMPIDEALAILEDIVSENPVQIGAGYVDWKRFTKRYRSGAVPSMYRNIVGVKAETPKANSTEVLEKLKDAPEFNRASILEGHILKVAAEILGRSTVDQIPLHQPLNELGLDSLLAVDFRNALANSFGQILPSTLLFSYPTVAALTDFLTLLIYGEGSLKRDPSEIENLALTGVENLDDGEVDRLLAKKLEERQ